MRYPTDPKKTNFKHKYRHNWAQKKGTHLSSCKSEFLAYLQWRTQEFFSGGVQQIQLRTEDRENGDLGAVAP